MVDQISPSQTQHAVPSHDHEDASEAEWPTNLGQRVLSRIPYTAQFKRLIKQEKKKSSKVRLDNYQKVVSIDEATKKELASKFQYSAERLSNVESWIKVTRFYTVCISVSLAILLFIFGPLVAARFSPDLIGWDIHGFWWESLEILVGIITALLGVIVSSLPLIALKENVREFFSDWVLFLFWGSMSLLAVAYCSALYTGKLSTWPWPFHHKLVFYLVVQAGIFYPLFFIVSIPVRAFDKATESRRRKLETRFVIIDELFDVLTLVERENYESALTSRHCGQDLLPALG